MNFQHNLHFLRNFINVLKRFQVKPQFLELFYERVINVLTKTFSIETVYQTFLKHCNVNIYLEMFSNLKYRVSKHFINY